MDYQTKIGIIGAGPAGLTLALLLEREGIECIILENRSRSYVESRVRAGLLEQNTVDLFCDLKVGDRLTKEGLDHHGVYFCFEGEKIRIPFDELTGGRHITIYGQQEVVKDLIQACENRGIRILFEAEAYKIEGLEEKKSVIQFHSQGEELSLTCDFVAGCDGFHGLSRNFLPADCYREFHKEFPFNWLGILADTKPSSPELIYSCHQNGFALHSLRSNSVSRFYLQVNLDDQLENWPDERIWKELETRLWSKGFHLYTGPITDRSITQMRSFVIDNLQYKRLFLAGDAAHIVPPTGGKGLNLAVADIKWLAGAFISYYRHGKEDEMNSYSKNALRRVWRAQEFSNFMTYQFHRQGSDDSFDYQLQKARFNYIKESKSFATTIAENYVGLKTI